MSSYNGNGLGQRVGGSKNGGGHLKPEGYLFCGMFSDSACAKSWYRVFSKNLRRKAECVTFNRGCPETQMTSFLCFIFSFQHGRQSGMFSLQTIAQRKQTKVSDKVGTEPSRIHLLCITENMKSDLKNKHYNKSKDMLCREKKRKGS